MGTLERAAEEKRANKRDRAKQQRGRRAANSGGFNLRGQDWRAIAAAIVAFAEAGGALRIGLTRDGGACAVGCYFGDDYATEYIRPNEDFVQALAEIAEAWLPDNGLAYHQACNEFERTPDKDR